MAGVVLDRQASVPGDDYADGYYALKFTTF